MAHSADASPKVSELLDRWLSEDQPRTLGDLIDAFGEKGFAIIFIVLLSVPALPLPTGGVTHVFEAVAILIAAQLMVGRRTIWLPARWRRLDVGGRAGERALGALPGRPLEGGRALIARSGRPPSTRPTESERPLALENRASARGADPVPREDWYSSNSGVWAHVPRTAPFSRLRKFRHARAAARLLVRRVRPGRRSPRRPFVQRGSIAGRPGGCSSHAGRIRCTALPLRAVLFKSCSAAERAADSAAPSAVLLPRRPRPSGSFVGAQPLSTNASTSPSTRMLWALCTAMPMSALR
jgi:Exopolysaccharide synthesis, ExoD